MGTSSKKNDFSLTLRIIHDTHQQNYTIPWEGQNVQQILEGNYNRIKQHKTFSFGLSFFGTYQGEAPLGYFVDMVDNIYDVPDTQFYWELLINEQPATHGIDLTYPQAGSTVTLQNVKYSEGKHRDTPVEIKHRTYMARTNRS